MIRIMSEPKTNYPRDLEEDFKLFCRSTPEVFEALGTIVAKVAVDKSIRFKGRLRPKKAQVVNAILLYFETLPPEEQVAAIKDGMARLNAILRQPYPSQSVAPETKMPADEAGSKGGFDLGSGGRVGKATYPSGHKRKRG